MAEDCLFCKIVAGEIPSTQVHADDLVVAIRDTGTFMDPRSRKDWWQGRAAQYVAVGGGGGTTEAVEPTPTPTPSP